MSGIREAFNNRDKPGHESAKRIMARKHFKVLYERNPDDIRENPEASDIINYEKRIPDYP